MIDHLAESQQASWTRIKQAKLKKKIELKKKREEAIKRGEDLPVDGMDTSLTVIEDKLADEKLKEEIKDVNRNTRGSVYIYILFFISPQI